MTRLTQLPQTASVSVSCAFAVLYLAEDQQAETVNIAPDRASALQWVTDNADLFPHQLIVIKLHY